MRYDLSEHWAAMLCEKRAIELAQLPIRHVRFCAAQARARQYRDYVQFCDDDPAKRLNT